jgi:hypothetical protein
MTASMGCLMNAVWAENGAGYCSGNAKNTPPRQLNLSSFRTFSPVLKSKPPAGMEMTGDRLRQLTNIVPRFEIRTGPLTRK